MASAASRKGREQAAQWRKRLSFSSEGRNRRRWLSPPSPDARASGASASRGKKKKETNMPYVEGRIVHEADAHLYCVNFVDLMGAAWPQDLRRAA